MRGDIKMKFRKEEFDDVIVLEELSKENLIEEIKEVAEKNTIIDLQFGVDKYYYALILIKKGIEK